MVAKSWKEVLEALRRGSEAEGIQRCGRGGACGGVAEEKGGCRGAKMRTGKFLQPKDKKDVVLLLGSPAPPCLHWELGGWRVNVVEHCLAGCKALC